MRIQSRPPYWSFTVELVNEPDHCEAEQDQIGLATKNWNRLSGTWIRGISPIAITGSTIDDPIKEGALELIYLYRLQRHQFEWWKLPENPDGTHLVLDLKSAEVRAVPDRDSDLLRHEGMFQIDSD